MAGPSQSMSQKWESNILLLRFKIYSLKLQHSQLFFRLLLVMAVLKKRFFVKILFCSTRAWVLTKFTHSEELSTAGCVFPLITAFKRVREHEKAPRNLVVSACRLVGFEVCERHWLRYKWKQNIKTRYFTYDFFQCTKGWRRHS